MKKEIRIRGAKEHNLKNISLSIPKEKLVVFTGVSGSGKSSLALDTIYAEGQRRYVESLSSYARQFLGVQSKPDVEEMHGLSPSIAINQKKPFHNPRSTVGTITEIYDYLRLLFARVGTPHCPQCEREVKKESLDGIVNETGKIIKKSKRKKSSILILSPLRRGKKGTHKELLKNLRSQGFSFARIDKKIFDLTEVDKLDKNKTHDIEVIVDQLEVEKFSSKTRSRLSDSISQALELSDGEVIIAEKRTKKRTGKVKTNDHLFSKNFACPYCGIGLAQLEPRDFSFNSPYGACPQCEGLGTKLTVKEEKIYNPRLSIKEGGILPLSWLTTKDNWFSRLLAAVGKKKGFDLYTPLGEFSPEKLEVLTWGTGKEEFLVKGRNRRGKKTSFWETFAGIAHEMEKRHEETSSRRTRKRLEKYMHKGKCPSCGGLRLKKEALGVTIGDKNISDVTRMNIKTSLGWSKKTLKELERKKGEIAKPVIREVKNRLSFLDKVGLSYLTLNRKASTLSGGEAQRIRLASQIGSGLSGVLYVLDEPSVGLHSRDIKKLTHTLKELRDLGNTVIVVEHDREMIEQGDYLVDFGPKGGKKGGKIVIEGSPEKIKKSKKSLTGDYLSGRKEVAVDKTKLRKKEAEKEKDDNPGKLRLKEASQFNLKKIDVLFPLGKFITVTGVSGSGKSTLVFETLLPGLKEELGMKVEKPTDNYKSLKGAVKVDRVYEVDQSPIGRTPRSNPATYIKAFSYIRKAFAQTKESRLKGFNKTHFSFNTEPGRCSACRGQGEEKIEMQFLSDIYVTCDVCGGARFSKEVLGVKYKGKTIKEVLEMTAEEALPFFSNISPLRRRLKTLNETGLGYLQLGQPAPTLSGGEAQRVRLAKELSKMSRGHTFYILDEIRYLCFI